MLVIAGREEYPGCGDILAGCSEFEIVARHNGLSASGLWSDLSRSDVILLDEMTVSRDGRQAVRRVHESFPFARILLIMEKTSRNKTMEALSMGITGVMERTSMLASIRKAIPVLCAGETWVSRGMVGSLHTQLVYAADDTLFPQMPGHSPEILN
ncbi:MAG: hypothetical protein R3308_08025 [Thiohalobacterales bacterium]|nr:hypothetical protein [Thiohalobacterales bacterium]